MAVLDQASNRSAFLLNKNARAVSPRLVADLLRIVPAGDVFLSSNLDEARIFAHTIIRRGYGRVFTGGGDGTLMSAVNYLENARAQAKTADGEIPPMPALGVLKLGTGNAMASFLGAEDPLVDAAHVVAGGDAETTAFHFVESASGHRAPFLGMGYDGEVLNDYIALNDMVESEHLKKVTKSASGYLGAMLLKTVPRRIQQPDANVIVRSTRDAYAIVQTERGDEERLIPAGEVVYQGPAPALSVGTMPYYGYKFQMFPHALRRPGYMQMRVSACGIPNILLNLYPAVWRGTYRHENLKDFLVEDIQVHADRELDFQVGGDAMGRTQDLDLFVGRTPYQMIRLGERLPMPARGTAPTGYLPAPA